MNLSPEALAFLIENAIRNDREWFQANKERFRQLVIAPLEELVSRLAPAMLELDGQLVVEPRVGRTISRVYRDTRFSKDKSLYRSAMWIVFQRDKRQYPDAPGFFFDLSPSAVRFGCGYYCASPSLMQALREMILEDNPLWLRVQDAMRDQDFFEVDGDSFKRTKYPDQPPEKRAYLDRKSLCFLHSSTDYALAFSDGLADELKRAFLALEPMYELFLRAMERQARE